MTTLRRITVFAMTFSASLIAFSADEKPRGPGGGKDGQKKGPPGRAVPIEELASLFRTDVPEHPLDVVLGRPTKDSISASVLAYADREGMIQYGPKAGEPDAKTTMFALKVGEPAEVGIAGLQLTSPRGRTPCGRSTFRTRCPTASTPAMT